MSTVHSTESQEKSRHPMCLGQLYTQAESQETSEHPMYPGQLCSKGALMQNTLILHHCRANVFHASFSNAAWLHRLQVQAILQGPLILFIVEWHLETNTKNILVMLQ